MDFLTISNKVLRAFNEVELTAANFTNSKGIQSAVKDFVNRSINDIYTAELEWPFLHADGTITTVAGTAEYSLESGYKSIDVDTVYLIESGTDIKDIPYIPYIQFTQQFRERDLDPTTTANRDKPDYHYLTQDELFDSNLYYVLNTYKHQVIHPLIFVCLGLIKHAFLRLALLH